MLVAETNSVVSAPGFSAKDKIVRSKSGSSPHLTLVSVSAKGVQYKCNDKCLNFKSIRICSHTLAAAEVNGDLKYFLQWFSKHRKQAPNLTKLSTHGMPAGAGKKGGQTARKKNTIKKPILTDENRVPLNTTLVNASDSRNHISVRECVSVPATCSVFNPTEASHVNNFNNYTGLSGHMWLSSVNTPDYLYSWPRSCAHIKSKHFKLQNSRCTQGQ